VCLNFLTLSPYPYQIESSKSRRGLLPNVCSHPRTRGTIRGQVAVAPFPRDLQIGHDPSLGAPMPGHHRAWPMVGRNPLRFALLSPGRKHRTVSSLSLSHHPVQAASVHLRCAVLRVLIKQCLCLQAAAPLYCTSPARRYNDLSRGAHRIALLPPKSMDISYSVSA
jgi:hypothetical protein